MAERCCLNGREGMTLLHLLDIGGDGEGSDCSKRQVAGSRTTPKKRPAAVE